MTIAIEMNHIGRMTRLEVEEPFARFCHLAPWFIHPFQFEIAFKNLNVCKLVCLFYLIPAEISTHRRECDLHSSGCQCCCQFQGIRPNTANRVSSHKDSLGKSGRLISHKIITPGKWHRGLKPLG